MNKIISILLVEDDPSDAIDFKRSLNKIGIIYRMIIARNGEEAIDVLNGVHTENFDGLPNIVLIDTNMPGMNGLELLSRIRNTDEWKHLKCFMLTTSNEKLDKAIVKSLRASGCIIKPFRINNPANMDSFNLMIDLINMKV